LLVVDAVSGVSVQTETVLRQALAERVQLTLVINKVDRCILEQKLDTEELYQKLSSIVARCNALIATYRSTDDSIYSDEHFDPKRGNVAFASGKLGWAFTIPQFATLIAEKSNGSKSKYLDRLWGESFYSPSMKKWVSYEQSLSVDDAQRGFNQLILRPVYQMLKACEELNIEEIRTLLDKLAVRIPADKIDAELQNSTSIMSNVMKRWLPASEAMLHLIVLHLPSPVQAQIYRIQHLYEGPQDDQVACSMKACDSQGDVMIYISKKIPAQDGSRFLCFGRIFSGTVTGGMSVHILGPNFQPGSSNDLQIKNITTVGIMIGDRCVSMSSIPAGNVVALTGIDKCLLKTGTVTTNAQAHNFRVMKFSVSPVVRVAVDTQDPTHHAKLVEGLKKLSQADSLVQVLNENGQHVIATAGELHLEICLADLEKTHARCPLKVATPIVTYRETITAESRQIAFTKTTNKHNKFFMRALPLQPGLAEAIESGRISSKQDPKERSKILVEEFGWELAATKKIWSFGPNDNGPNILVDATRAVDGLANVQDAIIAGFQWASGEGVLASESLHGVLFELLDVEIHRDSGKKIVCVCVCVFMVVDIIDNVH
jgi:elongation factor 2